MTDAYRLEDRFATTLQALRGEGGPDHVVAAVSGGCDSVVLLHLLRRVAEPLSLTVSAAHLDHRMRQGSGADALWVRDLCDAWEIPLVLERLEAAPASEAAARAARYEFLHRAASAAGPALLATAHTADDQAETVLFRAVRGTGLRGLAGIPRRTASGVVRPLLDVWRADLERYAAAEGLEWRDDPSNLDVGLSRNRIRHRILPELEATFAPAARRCLVSLAAEAAAADGALDRLARRAARTIVAREGPAWLVDRVRLREYDPAVATRVLRNLLRRLGPLPGRAGTRAALQFITDAASGRQMQLPGGLRIRTEFATARLEMDVGERSDVPLELDVEHVGAGPLPFVVGGVGYRAELLPPGPGRSPQSGREPWALELDAGSVEFPLRLRGWRPGDRIPTSGGTKPLKKLFLEERVARSRRAVLPVLTDASGRVLWVAGLRRAHGAPIDPGNGTLFLKITND